MVVEDMSEDMRRSSDVTGIVVRGVSPDGPAASADIRRGDILVSIARQQVESVAQFNELVEDLPRGEPIPALVVRANGLPTFVSINIPEE
jgi:serine protease Do